jgi:protein gp37
MENSGIEWTDNTFNPWTGCTKVSAGCLHCYAERGAKRKMINWGKGATRKFASETQWQDVIKWNKQATESGDAIRVFCASMCDVLDAEVARERKQRLWEVMEQTSGLHWQIVTKRPERYAEELPRHWMTHGVPPHVWCGATVENQAMADRRIPILRKVPAQIRFLSVEPQLEQVELILHLLPDKGIVGCRRALGDSGIHWVIGGGESGPGSRPMHPDWARQLRDQCERTGTAFFFKQWGEYLPTETVPSGLRVALRPALPHMTGERAFILWSGNKSDYTRVTGDAELNELMKSPGNVLGVKVGKKNAGHVLDGKEYRNFPCDRTIARAKAKE